MNGRPEINLLALPEMITRLVPVRWQEGCKGIRLFIVSSVALCFRCVT